jgi:hypothetical protein
MTQPAATSAPDVRWRRSPTTTRQAAWSRRALTDNPEYSVNVFTDTPSTPNVASPPHGRNMDLESEGTELEVFHHAACILMADDHLMLLEACKALLEPDFEVVRTVTEGRTCWRSSRGSIQTWCCLRRHAAAQWTRRGEALKAQRRRPRELRAQHRRKCGGHQW